MTDHGPGDGEKAVNRGGTPAALTPQHIFLPREVVARMPHATLDELADELSHLGGVRVCAATIRRTLRVQGIVRSMPVRQAGGKSVESVVPVASPKRYGHTAAHRREAGQYSTDLADAEWQLVADLFERPEGEPRCAGMLRASAPGRCLLLCAAHRLRLAAPAVELRTVAGGLKAFVRWVEVDAFEQMQDRLRQQWRARMGRKAETSAAVIDAQSNRASPQGGECGYDAGRKVKCRKRHLVVGLLLAVTVTAANVQDRDSAAEVVAQACRKDPSIERLYNDGA